MTLIEISGGDGRFSGIYTSPEPLVVLLDDEGPETPHRLIFQTRQLLSNFLVIAERCGSGFPDSVHTLRPSKKTPTYLYRKSIKSFTQLSPYDHEKPEENQMHLRQYKSKDKLLTGQLQEPMYLYLLQMISNIK